MLLRRLRVQRFRNLLDSGLVDLEPDVTALVGKNESGKSSVLHALYRLMPANAGYSRKFDITHDYPRWRLTSDRRSEDLERVRPIEAWFELSKSDLNALAEPLGVPALPKGIECYVARTYNNGLIVDLSVRLADVISLVGASAGVQPEDLERLQVSDSIQSVSLAAKDLAAELEGKNETAGAAILKKVPNQLKPFTSLITRDLSQEARNAVAERVPRFFYFSNYATLPGVVDLHALLAKEVDDLSEGEETARALLHFAGVTGEEFLDEKFESRKAELEAAAIDLTGQVFQFWKQNEDLAVEFADDLKSVGTIPQSGQPILHRFLDVRLKDLRHGGVTTNFATRSAGFQWFFSFLAAFTKFESSDEELVVLLDEPGTSLHGEAQRDFLRFIFERLGAKQQVIYTTHSQHMVDPARYEKLRAVEDRATRENPDIGALVTPVRLSADRSTVLPIQAALGYSINQHLFIGGFQHLVVEGGSDFVYLSEMSNFLVAKGSEGLDPEIAILPVGGADKIPAFVALLGKHLRVSVLLDGGRNSKHFQRLEPLIADEIIAEERVVLCSEVSDAGSSADIEDLFGVDDYLRLVNWAYGVNLQSGGLPETSQRITVRVSDLLGQALEHGPPAEQIARHRADFFDSLSSVTVTRFGQLMRLINAGLEEKP